MASWDIKVRTKHGLSLTVGEIVRLAIKEGFTNIENINYGKNVGKGCCRTAILDVNDRCKTGINLFEHKLIMMAIEEKQRKEKK